MNPPRSGWRVLYEADAPPDAAPGTIDEALQPVALYEHGSGEIRCAISSSAGDAHPSSDAFSLVVLWDREAGVGCEWSEYTVASKGVPTDRYRDARLAAAFFLSVFEEIVADVDDLDVAQARAFELVRRRHGRPLESLP